VTPSAPRHILLTAFEPFDGDAVNPSGEVAKQLDGRIIGDCVVRSAVLPVQHEAARAIVAPLLESPGLAAVVHLGLAGGRARISLERVAVNVMDYSRPDAHGQILCDVACAEEHNLEEPSMDLPLMLRAVEIILQHMAVGSR